MASRENLTDTNQSDSNVDNPIKCKRIGCENPSIDHPEWDREYCSAQCLSVYCK